MKSPTVSVIVAAYNALPYIGRCVDSVLGQSIGREQVELIVVNDGSTDGTAEELDRLASTEPAMQVIHQPNSGGPAQPRNAGMDVASGRYIFILDADDHLNPEALERMVQMADQNGSDVILGKMEAGGGRPVPRAMFRYNQPKADLFTSHVYWTLNPMKMYRRDFIERIGLRFRLDLPYGEDLPFVATAYLRASVISVVADYPCVHWVNRDDGSNITLRDFSLDTNMALARVMFGLVGEAVEPGPQRDHLFKRHFAYEIDRLLTCLALEPDRGRRLDAMREIAGWIDAYYNDVIDRAMQPYTKVCLNLIARKMADEIVEVATFHRENGKPPTAIEGDRVFALYPFFRDAEKAVPDQAYEATHVLRPSCHISALALQDSALEIHGSAAIDWLGAAEVTPVLRHRESDAEVVLGVAERDGESFSAHIDLLDDTSGFTSTPGHWALHFRLDAHGFVREIRPGPDRDDSVSTAPQRELVVHADRPAYVVDIHFTPYNNITVRVNDGSGRLGSILETNGVSWARASRATVEVSGTAHIAGVPADAISVALESDGQVFRVPATMTSNGSYVALVPLARMANGRPLPIGTWSAWFCLDAAGFHGKTPIRWNRELRPIRWRRGFGFLRSKAVPGSKGLLRITVAPVDVFGALTRRFTR